MEPNGQVRDFDHTFNHQLWFAASIASIAHEDENRLRKIDIFLKRLKEGNLSMTKSGRFNHLMHFKSNRLKYRLYPILRRSIHKQICNKEIGYHSFCLYALARLKEHNLLTDWLTKRAKHAIQYTLSKDFLTNIDSNKYSFPYNPPGFEIPYALEVFTNSHQDVATQWISKQITHSFDPDTQTLSRGTKDPATANARIYELTRCSDELLNRELPL